MLIIASLVFDAIVFYISIILTQHFFCFYVYFANIFVDFLTLFFKASRCFLEAFYYD